MGSKTILMADNLQDFLDVRKEFLQREGYKVILANNPRDAENLLRQGGADLAILDIRMIDDGDPEDTSGLDLAQKFGRSVQIIMLTGYPNWEQVKIALGQDINGLIPAVDFISKEEGPQVMIQAVKMTLEHPRLKTNVLQEFNAESSQALHETLQRGIPADTSDKVQRILDRTERELTKYRKETAQQSTNNQKIAIIMGVVGMIVILIGAILAFLELTSLAVVSGVASLVSEAISVLFINRAARSARQVDQIYVELLEIFKSSHLISICDTIDNKTIQEEAKFLIVKTLTGKWFS